MKAKWTLFSEGTPDKGARIVVRYPSEVECYGIWGKTFKENITGDANWFQLPELED